MMKKWQLILFIIGMVLLGLLAILSLIGTIYAYFPPTNDSLLTTSSSIFISSLSAFLTVGALIVTIIHNDKVYHLDTQKHEISTTRTLNKMKETLALYKIEINQYLQGKKITDRNEYMQEEEPNKLQMRLYFSIDELSDLKTINIEKLEQHTRTDLCGCPPLDIKTTRELKRDGINPIDDKSFYYELITNIKYNTFKNFRKYLLKNSDCIIGTHLNIEIADLALHTTTCDKNVRCKFARFDSARNVFVFEKI